MPTTANKEFEKMRPLPDGLSQNAEVFYHPSTNEVFENYEDYFERMIQLNAANWSCAITGKSGLTYDEALESEKEAIDEINNFPPSLETPILFLVHHFTCRARLDDLVNDVLNFMRDRYFMEVIYRSDKHKRLPARVIGIQYHPEHGKGANLVQNGGSSSKSAAMKSPNNNKSPKKEAAQPGLELCAPECFSYTLQILNRDGESDEEEDESSQSSEEDEGGKGGGTPQHGQVFNVPHTQIGRGRDKHTTRPRVKLFIRYYTELGGDGALNVRPESVHDFRLDQSKWAQVFCNCPEPKFPLTPRTGRKSKLSHLSSMSSMNGEEKRPKAYVDQSQRPSTSKAKNSGESGGEQSNLRKAEMRRRRVEEQQAQLEPLFKQAERAGVEDLSRWRQQFHVLSDESVQDLRQAILDAKAAEKERQAEQKRRERDALIEWRKPRDDMLCDDLQPFPELKPVIWPEWIPRELYWDLISIQCFLTSFAEVIFADRQNPFTMANIATAIVSRQFGENVQLYQLLDWLMTALNKSLEEDEGTPADLLKTEQIGKEMNNDIDHPVHGSKIRKINKLCEKQRRTHGAHVRAFTRTPLDITEIVRLHLATSGYYTSHRRQNLGGMHCYEDDGYQFVRAEPEIMDVLKKSSVFALDPGQRVKLITVLINQLLAHRRCRGLINKRFEGLWELKREFKRLKAVDLQHEKEAREAQQLIGAQQAQQASKAAVPAVSKDLASLRRALVQLNEGRRVQNIGEIRERLLDEHNPLPWTQMESVQEVQEFRTLQHNFNEDRMQAVLSHIYDLQGKMGMFFLGRDRAFRAYYYMCSAIIVHCPDATEELGPCGQPTPLKNGELLELDEEMEEEEEEDQSCSIELVDEEEEKNKDFKQYKEVEEQDMEFKQEGEELKEVTERKMNTTTTSSRPAVNPLMACTGNTRKCPVHSQKARLLYFIDREGVKKLLDVFNPRGFRESELAESMALFKEIYRKEMCDALDLFAERKAGQLPLSSLLFGFAPVPPRELAKEPRESASIGDGLWADVRNELLELEETVFERRLGTPRCTGSREAWRQALQLAGDTTGLCVNQKMPVLHSSAHSELLYTFEELNRPEELTREQKLAIALLQLVQGVRLDCLHAPFMNVTKKNGTVIKRVPSQVYMEWQRGLKHCHSPSAIALFMSTFEWAVDWGYNQPADEQLKSNAKVGKRQAKATPSQQQQPSTSAASSNNNARSSRPYREAEMLLANAAGLLVTGTRQRKPVTKYGECEMDLDKLNFGDEEEDASEESPWSDGEDEDDEMMPRHNGEQDDEDDEGDDSDGIKPRRLLRSHHDLHYFDGYGAARYEGLARKRKAVTHFDPTSYHVEAGSSSVSKRGREQKEWWEEEEEDGDVEEEEEQDVGDEHQSKSSTTTGTASAGGQNGEEAMEEKQNELEEWQQFG